jgi:ER membrane protein complex subunit 6
LVSAAIVVLKAEGKPAKYWGGVGEVWYSEVFNGLSGFVLTWTLFFGLVRA